MLNLRLGMDPVILLGLSAAVGYAQSGSPGTESSSFELPSQAIFIDPRSFTVLDADAENGTTTFRQDAFTEFFNPTGTSPPFFQVFDKAFLDILGPNASIHEVASNDTFSFAHEGPVYIPETDEVFFASNDGGPLGMSDLEHNSHILKISMGDVENGLTGDAQTINVPVTEVPVSDAIQMTNGGTGPYKGNILLITSGRGPRPPSIAMVNPRPPYNVTVLLNNYYGRQFNSLNDIKVHPSGKLFFTDVTYGFLNHFRDAPLMPNQIYRFDPDTGKVRVVAADFDKPNGIAFTKDGMTAYIADTGASRGFLGTNQTEPTTVYALDVDPKTHAFVNRRVLAYIDSGAPDGIQVDLQGNIFAGCGDGVQVFAPDGTLLGKIFINTAAVNMVFAPPNRLVILADTKIFVAKIAAKGVV